MNAIVSEAELKAKAVAPRVTDEQVEAFITKEYFFTAGEAAIGAGYALDAIDSQLDLLTVCVLVLANGFTVHGVSACADPSNYNRDFGQRLARQDAKNKIWAFLGFDLRSRLAMVEGSNGPSYPDMTTHVGTKVIHAKAMTRGEYNHFRGWQLPADEDGSDEGFLVEYADGGQPNVEGFEGYVSWSPKNVFERAYGEHLGVRSH